MDRAAVQGVLQRFVPPLSPDLVEKITLEICREAEEVSQSPVVAASSKGRTLRKRK